MMDTEMEMKIYTDADGINMKTRKDNERQRKDERR